MSWLGDQYAVHVLVSYGVTVVVLGALVWATIAANARARREMDRADKERKR